MFGIVHYETFLIAAAILIVTPGNDAIFIMTRSISQGKKAGVISALGVGTGSFIHTLLAAFGLSLIIAKSVVVFMIIKYAGAFYLIYIGGKMIVAKSTLFGDNDITLLKQHPVKLYFQAFVTDILNPKVALFFIAFLPQFINPVFGYPTISFLILGCTFVVAGTLWSIFLAIFSAKISSRLRGRSKIFWRMQKLCGLIFVALGIKLSV